MMRRIKIVGLSLVVVLAVAAFAASSALAAAPEFGRCVAKAGGKYASAACTTEVAGKTKFEWEPGPGPNNKFTSAIKVGTVAKLETVGKQVIECTGETSGGEIKNAKEVAKVVAKFTGCTAIGQKCESEGAAAGEIVTNALGGPIGVEKLGETAAKNKLAEDLQGENAEKLVATFKCAGLPIIVRGSVLHPIKSNKMVNTAVEKFAATKGKQKPEKFVGEPKDVLESSLAGGAFEQSGQTITANVKFEEKIEANSVV
jgi:hypothetical protein